MQLTLAETESYLRKAARACGLDWGIAEEAGKAARWLAAFNLPGPETLLAHLQQLSGEDYPHFIPTVRANPGRPRRLLCPIITGAALADRSAQMLDGKCFRLAATAYPLLLAATVGQAARCHRTVFTTAWAGVRVSCFENGLSIAAIVTICCSRKSMRSVASWMICTSRSNCPQRWPTHRSAISSSASMNSPFKPMPRPPPHPAPAPVRASPTTISRTDFTNCPLDRYAIAIRCQSQRCL